MGQKLARRALDQTLPEAIRSGWRFLARVMQMRLHASNSREPLSSLFGAGDEHLTAEQLSMLRAVTETSRDSEVQARVTDLLWLKTRDPRFARQAVRAYLASAERLEDANHWPPFTERLERAARLTRTLGRDDPTLTEVLDTILAKIRVYRGQDSLFLTDELAKLLYEFQHGDPAEIARYTLTAAERARAQPEFHRARAYYETTAKLYSRLKDKEAFGRIRLAIAETFREEAEASEVGGNYLAAHVAWTGAIAAYRKAPGGAALVPELQARLHAAAECSHQQAQGFEFRQDFTKQAEQATASVTGLDWLTALLRFTFAVGPIDVNDLRKITLDQLNDHPLQALVPITHFDRRGRTVDRTPSFHSDDPEEQEAPIQAVMLRNASLHRWCVFNGWLQPAFTKLTEEHSLTEVAIAPLVGHSGMVPPRHEDFFIRGLAAGFRGDLVVALCLLVPQIENSLRWVLHNLGTIPGSIDDDGIEEDWPLQRCLAHKQVEDCLGSDLVFELRSMLIEKGGPNLRNLLAHGLLAAADCYSVEGFYTWWLVLKIVLATSPAVREMQRKTGTDTEGPAVED